MMSVEQVLGSSEEGNARVGNAAENGNTGSAGSIQVHEGLAIPQQQPQNSLVRWERFLPIRSLKVLLVENDDCTRQVVSALLRNCSYEVTTAANGLQAWKILENMDNHIDLVLTEVAMPVVSGIGLLSKITVHKTLRNIPVIMMSSHDSMGIVFKCLSKGAVDFLVKPIRKNELKNLWQHVWRRCHSSSGSGSESGTQPRRSAKSKSADESGNNSDSSNELYDNGSNGLSICDGSDNGSGTQQSSWTKRAAVDSPRQFSHSYQLADAPDSTCAQVIHTKPETSDNKWVRAVDTKQHLARDEKYGEQDDTALGKNSDVGKLGNPDEQRDCWHENLSTDPSSTRKNILSDIAKNPVENGHHEHTSDNIVTIVRDQGPKPCSRNTNCINLHIKKSDASNGQATLAKDKTCCDSGDSPSLELSLKSMRGFGDGCSAVNDERNVLRHSDLSAFSKYKTTSSANPGPTGNVGSCSPLENSSVAMKTETGNNITFPLSGTLLHQQSNGSSNNDIASTAKNITPKPEAVNDKSESSSAFKSLNSSAFQPVPNGRISSPNQVLPAKIEDVGANTLPKAPCRGSTQKVQVQHHHHHHHHHYHHHHHNKQQNEAEPEDDHISIKDVAAASGQCGSSNIVEGPTEGTAGNYSTNGSGSRSNHGSNEPNGCSLGLNSALTNTESDNKACADAGAGGTGAKLSGNAVEDDRAAQREAALSKFRQKRKERCFEKRVRYQSRKRLAEQRPRVKGQFVRQSTSDNKSGKDVTSNDHTSEDNSCDSLR